MQALSRWLLYIILIFRRHWWKKDYMLNSMQSKAPANVRYAREISNVHHMLLANAAATKLYHSLNLGGMIGITFNLSPCLPFDPNNADDVKAVSLQDELPV